MPSSHIWPSEPSPLLLLICLAIIRRVRPNWLAVSVREAARAENINAERVSRHTTRAVGLFESVVAKLSRTGRPRKKGCDNDSQNGELALDRALLDVATSILRHVKLRKAAVRTLLVGAYLRLRQAHPQLTQKRFCKVLAVPERTFRSWLKKPPVDDERSPVKDDKPSRKRRPRPPRRPRFGFAVTVPGDQVAGDTTDLRAFGVPLKLIATQDIGGRDRALLDAIIVDDHESADLVVQVITESLAGRPGAQFVSDQGTPYLATKTREALGELEAEHAIQKEGDPLGKATIERAFGSVKRFASPLLELTNRIALQLGCLSQPDVAIAATTLLLTALLRAYQAGARASHRACRERPNDSDQFERVAEQSRHRARADQRSARLVLAHIHGAYDIDRPLADFVRQFRTFPVAVLRQAETSFARQAHRADIKNRTAYFAKLVSIANDEHRKQQARRWRDREDTEIRHCHQRRVQAERAAWHANPAAWLRDALDLVVKQWTGSSLLLDGAGVSTWVRQSLARLTDLHGPQARDVAAGVFRAFEQTYSPTIGPAGIAAVEAVLQCQLDAIPTSNSTPSSAARFAAMVRATGSTPRPPPSPDPC